jgi:hypothetical protein
MKTADIFIPRYIEDSAEQAINWLGIVAEFDNVSHQSSNSISRVSRVLRRLGNQIHNNDPATIEHLSTLEREAQLHRSESDWITDEEAQNIVRTKQLNNLTSIMEDYFNNEVSFDQEA